jgi:hypothetical protein
MSSVERPSTGTMERYRGVDISSNGHYNSRYLRTMVGQAILSPAVFGPPTRIIFALIPTTSHSHSPITTPSTPTLQSDDVLTPGQAAVILVIRARVRRACRPDMREGRYGGRIDSLAEERRVEPSRFIGYAAGLKAEGQSLRCFSSSRRVSRLLFSTPVGPPREVASNGEARHETSHLQTHSRSVSEHPYN